MASFADKHVLVTGAATGIGRATAEYLAENGAQVFGIGLDGEDGRAAFADGRGGVRFREADLTDTSAVNAAVHEMMTVFPKLDAVVNCAGVYAAGKRIEDVGDDEWQRVLDVNLGGIFRVCRATLRLLRDAGGGAVVNLASVHAEATVPTVPAYAASKAAVVGLSRQLALDYAVDNIRVNAVLVGSVATRMTLDALDEAGGAAALGLSFDRNRIARIADPGEIATSIGFLIGDEASFITGAAIQVDGGMLARLM